MDNSLNNQLDDYTNLVKNVLEKGKSRKDRTGVGTISIFGAQMRFDIREKFPLLTTKKVPFNAVLHELLWFISGDTNIKYLKDNKVNIWNKWADKDGNLGPVYGYQWRHWTNRDGVEIDQIKKLEKTLRDDPFSRRHILTAFNVGDLDKMALQPCHSFVQFYVTGDNELSAHLYQRSADLFLGVPFNIASYAAIVYMLCSVLKLKPGELIHSIGDAHIYNNHIDQVKEMLSNDALESPTLKVHGEHESITDIQFNDLELVGYKSHKRISAPIAV